MPKKKKKVYYHHPRKLFIEDEKNKPLRKIKEEFGDVDYQLLELTIGEETATEENGNLKKYNHKQQQDQVRQDLETERQRLIAIKPDIIHELHLTDQQFEDLKAICKWGL